MKYIIDFACFLMSGEIQQFYIRGGPDAMGRLHSDILNWSDERLEECHDHIQWMFPTAEKSLFAANYVCLTESDVADLRVSLDARTRILAALDRMCIFWGLGKHEDVAKWNWLHNGDHNLLRITRVIRSLRLFGLESEALEFANSAINAAVSNKIAENTLNFWRLALTVPPMQSMRNVVVNA